MQELVSDLLSYAQIINADLVPESTEGDKALRESLANLDGAVRSSGATVEAGPLPTVSVHRMHLQQLFQNLIGNAIKYRSKDRVPHIRVAAEQRDGVWQFSISDNGIGIKPEYRETVFGLFKRLHGGDEYSGTGIGLAICQRIVDRYGGRIWLESELGEGSTFFFTLPG